MQAARYGVLHDRHDGAHLLEHRGLREGPAHALVLDRQFPQPQSPLRVVGEHLGAGDEGHGEILARQDRKDRMESPDEQYVVPGRERGGQLLGQEASGCHFNECGRAVPERDRVVGGRPLEQGEDGAGGGHVDQGHEEVAGHGHRGAIDLEDLDHAATGRDGGQSPGVVPVAERDLVGVGMGRADGMDGDGDGGLGYMQALGGTCDIAKFADHLEIFKLSYVHRLPPALLILSIITW